MVLLLDLNRLMNPLVIHADASSVPIPEEYLSLCFLLFYFYNKATM
jgi:hypothetical protein